MSSILAVAVQPTPPPTSTRILQTWYPTIEQMARSISRRLPRHVPVEDLTQAGVLGLASAIERIDPERLDSFDGYAKMRIRGAMFDWMRAQDWVPRSVRRKANELDRARQHLRERNGEAPSRAQVAEYLELDSASFDRYEADSATHKLMSLDAPTVENGSPLGEQIACDDDTEEIFMASERRGAVLRAVQQLPDRERIAVSLFYLRGLKLTEIGRVLGVSESRACQLRSQGVKRLRQRLTAFLRD